MPVRGLVVCCFVLRSYCVVFIRVVFACSCLFLFLFFMFLYVLIFFILIIRCLFSASS